MRPARLASSVRTFFGSFGTSRYKSRTNETRRHRRRVALLLAVFHYRRARVAMFRRDVALPLKPSSRHAAKIPNSRQQRRDLIKVLPDVCIFSGLVLAEVEGVVRQYRQENCVPLRRVRIAGVLRCAEPLPRL